MLLSRESVLGHLGVGNNGYIIWVHQLRDGLGPRRYTWLEHPYEGAVDGQPTVQQIGIGVCGSI